MFKDTYKSAMDKIEPREGVMEQILADAENKIKNNVVPFPKRKSKNIKYAASVAAALVICVTAAVYPQLERTHSDYESEIGKNISVANEVGDNVNEIQSDVKDENVYNREIKEDTEENKSQKENAKNIEVQTMQEKKSSSQETSYESVIQNEKNQNNAEETNEVIEDTENNVLMQAALEEDKANSTENTAEVAIAQNEAEALPIKEEPMPITVHSAGANSQKSVADGENVFNIFDDNIDLDAFEPIEQTVYTQEQAVEYAQLLCEKFDEIHTYCDKENAVWRIDFVLNDEVCTQVYIAFEGKIYIQNLNRI